MSQYPNAGGPYASQPGFSPTEIESIKKSALTWTIVGFLCGGVIAGVLGLLGYLKADTEPQTAKSFTKWAMIVTIIYVALMLIIVILYIVFAVIMVGVAASSGSSY